MVASAGRIVGHRAPSFIEPVSAYTGIYVHTCTRVLAPAENARPDAVVRSESLGFARFVEKRIRGYDVEERGASLYPVTMKNRRQFSTDVTLK